MYTSKKIINKIVGDKGYKIDFDYLLIKNVDSIVFINVDNNIQILLNPYSNMSIYFLLIHEVSHIIKTQKLIDLVNKNIRMNHYFNKVVDNLKRMYNENDLNEEIYAEICAKIFRNKEFIMSLSAKNTLQSRNLIKKIYKSLKKIFNSITKRGKI